MSRPPTAMTDTSCAAAASRTGTGFGRIELTIGPVPYYWSRRTLIDFYARMAESPADTLCLGEAVCSRRHEMKLADWLDLGDDLQAAGKRIRLSTLALIESEPELSTLSRQVQALQAPQREAWQLEANDAAAVRAAAALARPWTIGTHVNVYSAPALAEYRALGAATWVPPVELPLADIGAMLAASPPSLACELYAFGKLPLALSARCFTARHHRLPKDDCGFRCIEDPDGLLLSSRDGTPFLTLNGIQTQSAGVQCVLGQADAVRQAGITRLRLSPCSTAFERIVALHDAVFNHDHDAQAALAELRTLAPGPLVSGFLREQQPGLLAA